MVQMSDVVIRLTTICKKHVTDVKFTGFHRRFALNMKMVKVIKNRKKRRK